MEQGQNEDDEGQQGEHVTVPTQDLPSLHEWLAGPEPDYDTDPTPEPLADQAKANAILRHLGWWKGRLPLLEEQYDAEQVRLDKWIELFRARARWCERWLANWQQAQYESSGTATVELSSGKLKSSKRTEWVYEDEEEFVAWASWHSPDLVTQPNAPAARPDKNAVKKALTAPDLRHGEEGPPTDADGEPVPGLVVRVTRTYKAEPSTDMLG